MSRIDKISHIQDLGVFHSFDWPSDLYTFGRFNLIYGWNGSGKTTLSRLFRALETMNTSTIGQVTLSLGGTEIGIEEYTNTTAEIRVFNRDFIIESVFPVSGGDVPPIFVVGRENVEKQKQIEELKVKRASTQKSLGLERSQKQKLESDFSRFCSDRAKVIKDLLRSPGPNQYNNYNKSDFQKRAEKMLHDGDKLNQLLNESDRDNLLAKQRSNPKPRLQLIEYRLTALKPLTDSISTLLTHTVVSEAIQSLKDDLVTAEWVYRGLELHHDRYADKCLFCNQTLPRERLDALEAHFNSEYEHFLKDLDSQISYLSELKDAAASIKWPNYAELYEDLTAEYEVAERALHEAVSLTQTYLDSLAQVLIEKKSRIFENQVFGVPVPVFNENAVNSLNEVIHKHNNVCDDFQNRMNNARHRLEAGSVAQELDEYIELKSAIQVSGGTLSEAEKEINQLNQEILHLEREIVEYRQPAEELNEDLRRYLGHDELRLTIKETGYSITRNNAPAKALSEGEMTAIALLYFLKSLKDRRFDLNNGIVVLDDPVSSLDANALYLAFGFIQERTKDAAQLFILTHNFAFFRQVRAWFHHLKGQRKSNINLRPARFYMLECVRNNDMRCSSIRPLDPLLEEYESEYHYIFARIYRTAKSSTPGALEDNYVLPNIARRLLETFLAFRQPGASGQLWQKLKNIDFDESKKIRIIRFLNTHSHSDVVGEPEHDPSLLSEAGPVLKDLLEFIKGQDSNHYASMVKLVDPSAEEEDSS